MEKMKEFTMLRYQVTSLLRELLCRCDLIQDDFSFGHLFAFQLGCPALLFPLLLLACLFQHGTNVTQTEETRERQQTVVVVQQL